MIIDELGKFLEKSTSSNDCDIYILQQLAEIANRSKGKFILIGILHSSFITYSKNLTTKEKEE